MKRLAAITLAVFMALTAADVMAQQAKLCRYADGTEIVVTGSTCPPRTWFIRNVY